MQNIRDSKMSEAPRWQFKQLRRNDEREDPVHEEFFRGDAPVDALVGEDTQNRLDARCQEQDGPIRIRYTFLREDAAISPETAQKYTEGLNRHLQTMQSSRNIEEKGAPMPCLLIEGFGTTGLTGDPEQHSDSHDPSVPKNNFYYFYRNKGRSPKSDRDRGRWGVGKVVYTECSQIRSFLGYTVREDDGRALLMGKSILKVHDLNGNDFSPNGYYATFADDGFALPIEREDILDDFQSDFRISRGGETGLSIAVPYPDESITPENVLRSMIVRFFYPIMSQTLVLEISEDGEKVRELKYETIRQFIDELDWSETDTSSERLLKLLDFTEWVLTLPNPAHVGTRYVPGEKSSPKWGEELFEEDELGRLRGRFLDGDRLVFRIPVKVKQYEEGDLIEKDSYFKICIEQDQELSKSEEHYIREGLTISHIRQLRKQRVRALLVVEEPALSRLIGDSENPAHTDWKERAEKVLKSYNRYEQGMYTVRFVKQGVKQIVRFLTRPPEGLLKDVMQDVFYVNRPPELEEDSSSSNGGEADDSEEDEDEEASGEPDIPDIPSQSPQLRVDRISGGIRVKNGGGDVMPESATVEVAYDTGSGNPFKKYDPVDFKLVELSVSHEGITVVKQNLNQLQFEIESPDFVLEVTGFDQHRDLRVSVDSTGNNQ